MIYPSASSFLAPLQRPPTSSSPSSPLSPSMMKWLTDATTDVYATARASPHPRTTAVLVLTLALAIAILTRIDPSAIDSMVPASSLFPLLAIATPCWYRSDTRRSSDLAERALALALPATDGESAAVLAEHDVLMC